MGRVAQGSSDRVRRAARWVRPSPGRGRPASRVPWDWTDIVVFLLVFYLVGTSLVDTVASSAALHSFGRQVLGGLPGPERAAVDSLTQTVAVYAVWLAGVLLLALGRRQARMRDLGWRMPRPYWVPLAIAAAVAALAILTGILDGIHLLFPHATNGQVPEVQREYRTYVGIAIPAVSVVAPVVEETFFRGFVYGWMRRRLNVPTAAVLSGCFFALLHFQAVIFLPLAVLGVGLALLYEYSGSLLPGMIVHGLFNLVEIFFIV